MLRHYRAVYRAPGTASLSAAAFLARTPIAIYPLGLILLFSDRSGHYGVAGLMTGVYVVANGLSGPVLARLVDRRGQSAMLLPGAAAHVAAVVALAVLVETGAPDWLLTVPVAAIGFAYLPLGSLVRARWSYVLGGMPELNTAYSLESTYDELIFTVGPVIASVVAVAVHPLASFALAAVLVGAGSVWLRRQTGTDPPVRAQLNPTFVLRRPGMVLLTVAMIGLGATFGTVEVTVAAFTGQHGERGLTGVVLAAFALGSATAGLVYGSRHWSAELPLRFCVQSGMFALLLPLFLLARSVPAVAVLAFVAGLGIAPTLITGFGLVDRIVPARSLTEGLSWLSTGVNTGYGAGAAAVGAIADRHGAHTAFLAPVGAGLMLFLFAGAVRRRLRPAATVGPAVDTVS